MSGKIRLIKVGLYINRARLQCVVPPFKMWETLLLLETVRIYRPWTSFGVLLWLCHQSLRCMQNFACAIEVTLILETWLD